MVRASNTELRQYVHRALDQGWTGCSAVIDAEQWVFDTKRDRLIRGGRDTLTARQRTLRPESGEIHC
jgi:hypothetical protein